MLAHTGVGLIGVAATVRKASVTEQKLDLVCEELHRHGLEPHKKKKTDLLMPFATGLAAGAVAHSMDIGTSHVLRPLSQLRGLSPLFVPEMAGPGAEVMVSVTHWMQVNGAIPAFTYTDTEAIKMGVKALEKGVQPMMDFATRAIEEMATRFDSMDDYYGERSLTKRVSVYAETNENYSDTDDGEAIPKQNRK